MKIYVAAPFAARDLALGIATQLTTAGHECTSSWILSTRPITPTALGPSPDTTDEDCLRHALGDLDDVRRADALLHVTAEWALDHGVPDHRLHTGGRHIEFGVALALGKFIVSLGEPENIFQRALSRQVRDVDAAIVVLEAMEYQKRQQIAMTEMGLARLKVDYHHSLEPLME